MNLFNNSWDDFWSRPVGRGAAWRRSPHQKPAGRDKKKRKRRKERKRKRKEEKEKRGEKMERRGGESKRERCIRPMGVKHPLRTVKRYKTHKTRRAEKKFLKKQEERKKRQKWPEKMWWQNRLRCENIGFVVLNLDLLSTLFKLSEKGLSS